MHLILGVRRHDRPRRVLSAGSVAPALAMSVRDDLTASRCTQTKL